MSRLSGLALAGTFALASIPPPCFAGEKTSEPKTKPQLGSKPAKAPIGVSVETTFLVGPLTDDGRVDYVAAFNERLSKGVTLENNAVVPFLQAIGLSPLKEEVRDRYVKLLGIEAPPAEGEYFVSLGDFLERQQPGLSRDEEREYYDRLEETWTKPWNPDEYPMLAAWLEENRKPLDLIVRGMRRPRFYSPLVGKHLLGAVVYDVNSSVRAVARALPARAMLRLQTESVDAAWEDLIACLRLARHHIQGSTVVQLLMGNAVQVMACDSARALASYASPTTDQLRQMQNDLKELGPISLTDDHLLFERCTMLEHLARWSRKGPSESELEFWAGLNKLFDAQRPINWSEMLEETNRNWDRLSAIIARRMNVEKQVSAFKQFERENNRRFWGKHDGPIDCWNDFESLAKHVMEGKTPETRAQRFVVMYVAPFASALENALWLCGRASDDLQLTRITFALADYRRDRKAYPDSLSDLPPKYIDTLGKSRIAESEFSYRRIGTGFNLSNLVPGSATAHVPLNRTVVVFDRKSYWQAATRLGHSGWNIVDRIGASSRKATVVDEDLLLLAYLPTMESVSIDDASNVTDVGLAHLADMPRLRSLNAYDADSITDDGILRFVSAGNLRSLSLPNCHVTDIGARHISGLTNLTFLSLSGTQLSDEGLAHISRLTKLTSLYIRRTRISDVGLVRLRKLLELEWLDLSQTNITDVGLVHLRKLLELEWLDLSQTNITDAGLAALTELKELKTLRLGGAKITDAGAPQLAKIQTLESLTLEDTDVADDGLRSIGQIGTLTWLDLSSTKITERGLPHLYTLKNLKYLSLFRVPISESALEQLEQALPNCEISPPIRR